MTEPILNIYKTDDWTAHILTDESGIVIDCEIRIKPTSEFTRRTRERQRTPFRYKNKRTLQAKHHDENSFVFEDQRRTS